MCTKPCESMGPLYPWISNNLARAANHRLTSMQGPVEIFPGRICSVIWICTARDRLNIKYY